MCSYSSINIYRSDILATQVMRKLVIETPAPSLVDAYLGEIAKGYGIEWTPQKGPDSDGEGNGDLKVKLSLV